MQRTAYLILENDMIFEGKSFGFEGEALGELVFTTAMTGYLETLTDPSYYGQIVLQTFPLIGNYGVIPDDFEGEKPQLSGYVVREWCPAPSNFRSEDTLENFLTRNKITGIYDVDTREITKIVREYGVMNAKITFASALTGGLKDALNNFKISNAVEKVTCDRTYTLKPDSPNGKNIVLWDFGAKKNICRRLLEMGFTVTCVPAGTTAEEILTLTPDGIMLSNGPGDPAENITIIEEIKKLMPRKIPTFGICLGHQLLALANGAETGKLKYGHRGANQPVVNTENKTVYITSQNHGYSVISSTLPDNAFVSYTNGNDNTCEGIKYTDTPAFSVQFHPEAAAGPLDTRYLFNEFFDLIKENKNEA
jgi:carbamoyl-phosphate synthase small subunit